MASGPRGQRAEEKTHLLSAWALPFALFVAAALPVAFLAFFGAGTTYEVVKGGQIRARMTHGGRTSMPSSLPPATPFSTICALLEVSAEFFALEDVRTVRGAASVASVRFLCR